MRQHKGSIVEVITTAYEIGLNVPQYYFQRHYEEMKEVLEGHEMVVVSPMYFIKPSGVEFNYTVFWTGSKFRGGYVTIDNNYTGVGKGQDLKGSARTMVALHVPEIKRALKRAVQADNPVWLSIDLIYDGEKIYFWGYGDLDVEMVSKLTGIDIEELSEKFVAGDKVTKPEGFVAKGMVMPDGFFMVSEVEKSVTAAWKDFYHRASMLKKTLWYNEGLDGFMRKGYSKLIGSGKL